MRKPKASTYGYTARQLIRHRNIMLGLPIRKLVGARIPYGYEIDPENEGWLRPIDRELRLLYKAKQLRKRSTMLQLATWLSKETGKKITRHTLESIFSHRPPLNVYELPLDQRLRIATCPTEDAAIELASGKRPSSIRAKENRRKYYEERERGIQALREERKDNLSTQSGATNGVPRG